MMCPDCQNEGIFYQWNEFFYCGCPLGHALAETMRKIGKPDYFQQTFDFDSFLFKSLRAQGTVGEVVPVEQASEENRVQGVGRAGRGFLSMPDTSSNPLVTGERSFRLPAFPVSTGNHFGKFPRLAARRVNSTNQVASELKQ